MSTGLLALLDDIAALAKVAAASLDDVSGQAARAAAQAGTKAVGVVIDDAVVTPAFVRGFAPSRELPIVARIAAGSVRNKLLYVLPAALVLSWAAPWLITPVLMLGGLYLSFEGTEAVWHRVRGRDGHDAAAVAPPEGVSLEDAAVDGAVRTDLILSAEIMAVALGTVAEQPLWLQAVVLAVVGLGITALVYGVVAIIVKADDAGLALARQDRPVGALLRRAGRAGPADRALRPVTQAIGRLVVRGMPPLLHALGLLGTAAMLWVGGGILLHGLEQLGLATPAHLLEHATAQVAAVAGPAAAWAAGAAISGLVGLAVGATLLAVVAGVARPLLRRARIGGGGGGG